MSDNINDLLGEQQQAEELAAERNAFEQLWQDVIIRTRQDYFGAGFRGAKISDMNVLQSRGTETEAPPSYFRSTYYEYYNEDWQKPFERAAEPYLSKTIVALKDLASKIADRILELPSESVYSCVGYTSEFFESAGACITSEGGRYSYVGHSSSVGVDYQIGLGNASIFLEGMGYAVTWPIGTGSLGLGFTPSDPLPIAVFWSPTTEFLPSASASYGTEQGNPHVEKKISDLFQHIEMGYGRWLNDAERQLRSMSQDPISTGPLP